MQRASKRRRLEELNIDGYLTKINDGKETGTFDESICLVNKSGYNIESLLVIELKSHLLSI